MDARIIYYTTKVKTQDQRIYDIGEMDFPPTHYHGKDGRGTCPACFVVNAWTEQISQK